MYCVPSFKTKIKKERFQHKLKLIFKTMYQLFTASQLTSFFTSPTQMGLSSAQKTRLAKEGLTTIEDFTDFKEDQLEQAVKNMRIAVPGVAPKLIPA